MTTLVKNIGATQSIEEQAQDKMDTEELGQFVLPKPRNTRKRKSDAIDTTKVPTRNQFQTLDTQVRETEAENTTTPSATKKYKVPPIILHNFNLNLETSKNILQQYCKNLVQLAFKNNDVYFYTSTPENYNTFLTRCKEKKYSYHTFTPP